MSDLAKQPPRNRGQYAKGKTGNPAGRPSGGTSAGEINRGLMKKYGSWERLARVAAGLCPATDEEQATRLASGKAAFPEPTISEQLNALKLQAAYGYGQPTQTVEGIEGLLFAKAGGVTVNLQYVDKQIIQNVQSAIATAPSGPGESLARVAPVQLLPDGAPLGEVDAGPRSDRAEGD